MFFLFQVPPGRISSATVVNDALHVVDLVDELFEKLVVFKQVASHMIDVLELSFLLLVLDGLLIDHVVQEKEVNSRPYLTQNLDQFKTCTFLHNVKFLFFSQ